MSVIKLVSPENLDVVTYNKKTKEPRKRNLYRPWLIDGFYLALLGGRNEEVTNIRWNQIKLNNEGQMSFIQVVDFKRTRTLKNKSKLLKDDVIKKNIEMTTELEKLLNDLGYNEKKGTDEFILANDEISSRKHMSDILSGAFNHLLSQLNLTENKKFKNLRKTYATDCYLSDPENFYKRMGHTNKTTTLNHYVDMEYVMEERRKILYKQKGK
jgi:integrase